MKIDKEMKKCSRFFWGAVLITSLISAVILTKLSSLKIQELFKIYMIVLLFTIVFEILSVTNHLPLFYKKNLVLHLSIGYFITSVFLCLDMQVPIYFLWMIGSIYIAKKINPYAGMVFHLIATYLLCSFHGYGIEFFIYNLMIGCILCLLLSMADSLLSFFYVFIIVGSIQIILTVLMHNFLLKQALTFHALSTVLSGWLLVICSFYIHSPKVEEGNKIPEKIPEKIEILPELKKDEYLEFISKDAPLISRLYEEKPHIYRHSLLIGILSQKAAVKIGADGILAKAGGLYHEIGKLESVSESKNYIEAGALLAMNSNIPSSLVDIIRQQSGKMDKPNSKEAAIVMLTDNIINAIKYFEKQPKEKKCSNDKIINDIFRIRLEQGALDNATLSIKEYQILKEFYRSNLPKGEKNDNNI